MKKRILCINNKSKVGIGTSTILLQVVKRLHNEFDIEVISDKHSAQLKEALEKLNVSHHALPDRIIFYLPTLILLIVFGKFDLVYGNGSNERSRGAILAAKITGRPFIWHIHESLRSSAYAGTIQFADAVIANSKDTAERLCKYAQVKSPIVIGNGIELENFKVDRRKARSFVNKELDLQEDWVRIITLGNVISYKNQLDVIRVAAKVVIRFPKTYFIIRGNIIDLQYYDEIRKMITEFGLLNNVLLCGYTNMIGEYLSGSDLMLHTSQKESQGLVILEAMASRLPVVAYNVGGVGESIINGETGYLLPDGDVDGLTEAVLNLIEDPDLRKCMGEAGYQRVSQHFTSSMSVNAIREVVCQVLSS